MVRLQTAASDPSESGAKAPFPTPSRSAASMRSPVRALRDGEGLADRKASPRASAPRVDPRERPDPIRRLRERRAWLRASPPAHEA